MHWTIYISHNLKFVLLFSSALKVRAFFKHDREKGKSDVISNGLGNTKYEQKGESLLLKNRFYIQAILVQGWEFDIHIRTKYANEH